MKSFLHILITFLFLSAILFANPVTVFASEEDGEHELEVEVNGYHIALASQNEWVKGENMIVVTIRDDMGMPVSDADVELLITPKVVAHTEPEPNSHAGSESDSHVEAEASHDSMSGMDMGEPEPDTSEASIDEEEIATPVAMIESHEHGEYMVETHLETSGEYDVQVFFHVNGEMMQADSWSRLQGWHPKLSYCGVLLLSMLVSSFPPALLKSNLFLQRLSNMATELKAQNKNILAGGNLLQIKAVDRLMLTTDVVASGSFFERRTFCRYVCFLGGLSGNYARTGMLALPGTPEICATCTVVSCYKGTEKAPGCPLFEFPKNMTSNANCVICADCIKNCPNASIQLTVRPPTKELWFIRKPKMEEPLCPRSLWARQ